MSDILSRIKAGLKNHKILLYPGTDVQVRMNLLSEADTLDAIAAADQMFKAKKLEVTFHTVNAFENEKAVQMLYRALRDADNVEPLVSSIADFRKLLTSEYRTALIEEYNSLSEECSPSPVTLSADEFDRLIETVKKNPRETIGNTSSLSTLRKLTLSLAEELASLQKANGPISS
ncbi:MAG TPA: hypothetical protein VHO70_14415 [Chitinispirillaceae bacterium]|nr:hypothetical protein [Chitinispirillaceae bacterium]